MLAASTALALAVAGCGSSNSNTTSNTTSSSSSTPATTTSSPAASVPAVPGCGSASSAISGSTLTIYSSLPLQGSSRPNATAVENGATLALAAVGGKVGKYTIVYKKLDDSTAQAGKWDPGQTTNDAHTVINDSTAAGYIGEFNSGASAISIPLLNQGCIPQISPSNTAVGLTANVPGSSPGEPEKYYPTGKRTYVRIVPKDTIQAAAQVSLWKASGCTSVYIFNDQEVYGAGLARNAVLAAPSQGIKIAANVAYDPKAANYRSEASTAASSGADCVFESNIDNNNAVQLTKDIAAAMPKAKIFAPDGDTDTTFFDPKQGGIPASLDSRVLITVATLDPTAYPPAGQAFFKSYSAKYGTPVAYAIYGYESMALMLDAISRATSNGTAAADRVKIIDGLFGTKDRSSVLGTYSIDQNGDTTLTAYGVWKIVNGKFVFSHVIKASA
jgi:branched-chain amino acid transport system substrate-binding protein